MSTDKTGYLEVPGFRGFLEVREDMAKVKIGGVILDVAALSNVAGEFDQFLPAAGKVLTLSNTGTIAGGDAWSLAIAAAKTLTVSNTITLVGTDGTTMTFPATTATLARTDAAQSFIGLQTFADLQLTASSASTDGGTSIEPFNVDTTMTGVGGVGGRGKFTLTTNVALGGWSNALKAQVTYGAAGKTTGLGSAFVAEMALEAGCVDGSYAPLEIELGMPENAVTGTRTSFLSINAYGHATGLGRLDDNGFLFDLNGLAAGAAHLFRTGLTAATINAATTAALRIQIGGTTYYIPIATATA